MYDLIYPFLAEFVFGSSVDTVHGALLCTYSSYALLGIICYCVFCITRGIFRLFSIRR